MSKPKVRTHTLKIQKEYYEAIIDGSKTFEVRKHDRDYAVGDKLVLKVTDNEAIAVTVIYVLIGGQFGIDKDYCVLGIKPVTDAPFVFIDNNVEKKWITTETELDCPCCNGSGHVDDTKKYRHLKRGTEYTVIGKGKLLTETPLSDNAEVVVYQGDDGKLWVRSEDEFNDGRFKEVQS